MATTVDHLSVNHRLRVIQPFTDANGTRFDTGFEGVISRLDIDWATREIVMEVDGNGDRAHMRFALSATDGPRNGRMREYFEVGDLDAAVRPRRAGDPPPADARELRPVAIPELVGEVLITDPAREEEALTRVWALAARRRFDEARDQLIEVNGWPDASGERSRSLAGPIGAAAVTHAWDDDETVYRWLRDWSINLWYQWGAGATSGGDGAARAVHIRRAEGEWAQLEGRRRDWRERRAHTSREDEKT